MEIIGLKKAAQLEKVSVAVVRKWCLKHGIGRKDGARWVIDPYALRSVANASRTLGIIRS